jgi:ubiquinone/menaquinone biosynthesis C-methylase UbiE
MEKQTDPAFDSILRRWEEFSEVYSAMDSCPQTFFFTLINLLKIQKSTNILEIACGAGLLIPFVVDQKRLDAQYIATDLTPAMVKIAEARLKSNF